MVSRNVWVCDESILSSNVDICIKHTPSLTLSPKCLQLQKKKDSDFKFKWEIVFELNM